MHQKFFDSKIKKNFISMFMMLFSMIYIVARSVIFLNYLYKKLYPHILNKVIHEFNIINLIFLKL